MSNTTKKQKSHIHPENKGKRMGIASEIREGLRRFAKNKHGNATKMARKLGLSQSTVTGFVREKNPQNVNSDNVFRLLDEAGARIIFPDQVEETEQSVAFIAPQAIDAGDANVAPDQYKAIPLVDIETAATAGQVPEKQILGWCLLWKHIPALVDRSNLVCIKVGSRDRAMMPTICPDDYILVDRVDKRIVNNSTGNIYLVRDPHEGIQAKRLRLSEKAGRHYILAYSDNGEYPPDLYDLEADYNGEPSNAIVGKIVFSWASMLNK